MPREKGKAELIGDYYHVRVGPLGCRVVGTKKVNKKGVLARVCCPVDKIDSKGKCEVGTEVKSLLYPKSQYSKAQAEKSARQFRK